MRDGDKLLKMFEILVEEHSPMLASYLAALTGSRQDAEDIAQETFMRAYLKFDGFDGQRANFPAWLRAIGRNLAAEKYRRKGRIVSFGDSSLAGVEELFAAADAYGAGETWPERVAPLRECLAALPERLQSACRLHYFDGLTAKVVSARLGVTLDAILKRLERARKILRECVERKLGLDAEGISDGG